MRGVRFRALNSDGYLQDVLFGINIERYVWHIDEDEIFIMGKNEYLFTSDTLSGKEFFNTINFHTYYIIFGNMQGYPIGTKHSVLKTYDDFVKSKCEIALLISDKVFVDVYCKSIEDIEIIKSNAERNNYKNIEYMTDINDMRLDFSAH